MKANNFKIFYHCDDLGYSKNQINQIFDSNLPINAISILPNSKFLKDIKKKKINKKISCHINIVEGKSLLDYEKIPNLVNEEGYFKNDFISLMLLCYNPFKRKKIKKELYFEIREQILHMKKEFDFSIINIDSHQHTHMIPFIFKIIIEIIKNENLDINEIRIAKEPLFIFIKHISLYKYYNLSNFIKNILLNLFSFINLSYSKIKKIDFKYNLFCGLMLSGNMNYDCLNVLLPELKKKAMKKNKDLELLFHSFTINEKELLDPNKKGFVEFYLSDNRKNEINTILKYK